MTAAMTESADMVFTEAAARKVAELVADEGDAALKLSVYITGGGCSAPLTLDPVRPNFTGGS